MDGRMSRDVDRAVLVAQIEAITNARVSTRSPILSSRGAWKAIAHGGSCGLRACGGTTEADALERLLASVSAESEIPSL